MSSETLTISLLDTSTRQKVSSPFTSTRQKIFVFVGNQSRSIDWEQLRSTVTYSSPIPRTPRLSEAYETMIASESILRREWDLPEEDDAWADL